MLPASPRLDWLMRETNQILAEFRHGPAQTP